MKKLGKLSILLCVQLATLLVVTGMANASSTCGLPAPDARCNPDTAIIPAGVPITTPAACQAYCQSFDQATCCYQGFGFCWVYASPVAVASPGDPSGGNAASCTPANTGGGGGGGGCTFQSCNATTPSCGQTTTGVDNCNNPCTKNGPACVPTCTGCQTWNGTSCADNNNQCDVAAGQSCSGAVCVKPVLLHHYQTVWDDGSNNFPSIGTQIPASAVTNTIDFSKTSLPTGIAWKPNLLTKAALKGCVDSGCVYFSTTPSIPIYTWADAPANPQIAPFSRLSSSVTVQWATGANPFPGDPSSPAGTLYKMTATNLDTNLDVVVSTLPPGPVTQIQAPLEGLTANSPYRMMLGASNGDVTHTTNIGAAIPFWTLPAAPPIPVFNSGADTSLTVTFGFNAANPSTTQNVLQASLTPDFASPITSPLIPQASASTLVTVPGLTKATIYYLRSCAISLDPNANHSTDDVCSPTSLSNTPGAPVVVNKFAIESGITLDNIAYGVPPTAVGQVTFNVPLNPASLNSPSKITVSRMTGFAASVVPNTSLATAPVPVTVAYDDSSGSPMVTITPNTAGGWQPNTVYIVTIAPGVSDLYGTLSLNSVSYTFVTSPLQSQANAIITPLDTAQTAVLQMPTSALPVGGFIVPRTAFLSPRSPLTASPASLTVTREGVLQIFNRTEIDIYPCPPNDPAFSCPGATWGASSQQLTLTLHAQPNLQSPQQAGVDPTTLSLYIVQPQGLVKVPGAIADCSGAVCSVTGTITQSGLYALAGALPTALDSSYAFPVPYKASVNTRGIIFTGLATDSTIKIYTIMGELVKQLHNDGDTPTVNWNPVQNSHGDNVASGVYIYQIKNPYSEKRGKLVIIR